MLASHLTKLTISNITLLLVPFSVGPVDSEPVKDQMTYVFILTKVSFTLGQLLSALSKNHIKYLDKGYGKAKD